MCETTALEHEGTLADLWYHDEDTWESLPPELVAAGEQQKLARFERMGVCSYVLREDAEKRRRCSRKDQMSTSQMQIGGPRISSWREARRAVCRNAFYECRSLASSSLQAKWALHYDNGCKDCILVKSFAQESVH